MNLSQEEAEQLFLEVHVDKEVGRILLLSPVINVSTERALFRIINYLDHYGIGTIHICFFIIMVY